MAKDPAPALNGHELGAILGKAGYSPREIRKMSPKEANAAYVHAMAWTPVLKPMPVAITMPFPEIMTVDALTAWMRDTKPTPVVYFHHKDGLATWKYVADKRIKELESLQDNARPSKPRPSHESLELADLQKTRDLAMLVGSFAEKDLIYIYQRRHAGQWLYIAIRKGQHP